MRLQQSEKFYPPVDVPKCLLCPPCVDCRRAGTATIASGFGLGAGAQQVYVGLLKGTKDDKKLKILSSHEANFVRREGTAALGPVGTAVQTRVQTIRENTRMRLQFEMKEDLKVIDPALSNPPSVTNAESLATWEDPNKHAQGCSYYPFDSKARTEYLTNTHAAPEWKNNSMEYLLFGMLALFIVVWLTFVSTSAFEKLEDFGAILFVVFAVILIALFSLWKQNDADGIREDMKKWHAAASLAAMALATDRGEVGNFMHPKCEFTDDISKAAVSTEAVPYHKTLFHCPTQLNCPAEELYFDEGFKELVGCNTRGTNDQDGGMILPGIDGAIALPVVPSSMEIPGVANSLEVPATINAGNSYSVPPGRTGTWTCTAAGVTTQCTDKANWVDIANKTCADYVTGPQAPCNRTFLNEEFPSSGNNVPCIASELDDDPVGVYRLPDENLEDDIPGELCNPNNDVTWTVSNIEYVFSKYHGGDIRSFISPAGQLSPLDACCACGGGGVQKEALQQCERVIVQEAHLVSAAAKKKLDEENAQKIADGESVDASTGSKLSFIARESASIDNAGAEGPLCQGCKNPTAEGEMKWIMQSDGTCLKCDVQDSRNSLLFYICCGIFLFVLKVRKTSERYKQEAVDMVIRNLKTTEYNEDHADAGKPIFEHLGKAKGALLIDMMKIQTERAVQENAALAGESDAAIQMEAMRAASLAHTALQAAKDQNMALQASKSIDQRGSFDGANSDDDDNGGTVEPENESKPDKNSKKGKKGKKSKDDGGDDLDLEGRVQGGYGNMSVAASMQDCAGQQLGGHLLDIVVDIPSTDSEDEADMTNDELLSEDESSEDESSEDESSEDESDEGESDEDESDEDFDWPIDEDVESSLLELTDRTRGGGGGKKKGKKGKKSESDDLTVFANPLGDDAEASFDTESEPMKLRKLPKISGNSMLSTKGNCVVSCRVTAITLS
eukprot:COSAG05_NODE_1278_length_5301_cov_2.043253_2_plen_957_part_00